jgi:hypothetical protein
MMSVYTYSRLWMYFLFSVPKYGCNGVDTLMSQQDPPPGDPGLI